MRVTIIPDYDNESYAKKEEGSGGSLLLVWIIWLKRENSGDLSFFPAGLCVKLDK